jgi:hypothetical protein
VQVGGGRASTRWRILIHKLRPDVDSGHSTRDNPAQQQGAPDTALEHRTRFFQKIDQVVAGQRARSTPPPRPDTGTQDACEHGEAAGRLSSGLPRCPLCRSQTRRR